MIYNEPKEITWRHVLVIAVIVITVIALTKIAENREEQIQIVNEHVAEIPIDNLK